MDFTVVLLSVIALFSQGYAAKITRDQEHLLNDVKEWFKETFDEFKYEISKAVAEIKHLLSKLKEKCKSVIKDRYEISRNQLTLMSLPPECVQLGQEHLQAMMDTSIEEFLLCPNLTLAAQDVVGMGFEGAKLSAQLLEAANEVINGFGQCWSWNPVRFIYCSFEWVKESVYQAFLSIKDFKLFFTRINFFTVNIKDQFSYCMNQKMAQADLHTVQVLNQVHKCTLKGDQKLTS